MVRGLSFVGVICSDECLVFIVLFAWLKCLHSFIFLEILESPLRGLDNNLDFSSGEPAPNQSLDPCYERNMLLLRNMLLRVLLYFIRFGLGTPAHRVRHVLDYYGLVEGLF